MSLFLLLLLLLLLLTSALSLLPVHVSPFRPFSLFPFFLFSPSLSLRDMELLCLSSCNARRAPSPPSSPPPSPRERLSALDIYRIPIGIPPLALCFPPSPPHLKPSDSQPHLPTVSNHPEVSCDLNPALARSLAHTNNSLTPSTHPTHLSPREEEEIRG
ncbi:hypothetical protein IE53DRAFT_387184 [Violaceomyces palustris]|uniref:Uncharacterized protein n=1 Tax=Violaceomyces palustris TaxID=1673888 RepID=A0ACD0NXM8_9BASI|nr:hypothetical protein IE53DRAFT_387184 [Violaceomyces palustris]